MWEERKFVRGFDRRLGRGYIIVASGVEIRKREQLQIAGKIGYLHLRLERARQNLDYSPALALNARNIETHLRPSFIQH